MYVNTGCTFFIQTQMSASYSKSLSAGLPSAEGKINTSCHQSWHKPIPTELWLQMLFFTHTHQLFLLYTAGIGHHSNMLILLKRGASSVILYLTITPHHTSTIHPCPFLSFSLMCRSFLFTLGCLSPSVQLHSSSTNGSMQELQEWHLTRLKTHTSLLLLTSSWAWWMALTEPHTVGW